MLNIDCILHFHTVFLISCSLHSCMRACLSICLYLRWLHVFWAKTNRIYKQEFLGVSKETTAILDPCITASNILNRREKNLPSLPKKWVREKKRKVTGAVKLSRSHPSAKIRKGFWKHQYLINVYSTGTLPQLISRIT